MENAAIRMQGLSFTYAGADAPVLRDIDLNIGRGKFTVIMGRTGVGKTTLALVSNGIIPQLVEGTLEGSVVSGGYDLSKFRVQTAAKEVGLVLQDPETQIFGRTVEEDVAFGPRNYLVPREEIFRRIKQALAKVRLDGYEKRQTSQLSGGEKQRLAIAGILAMSPSILILDEPTSELDPIGREEIYSTMCSLQKTQGITVVAIEHSSQEISEKADEIVVLGDGRIVWQGDPKEFFRDLPLVDRWGIKPLPVSCVGWSLFEKGYIGKEEIPLGVDEAHALVRRLLGGRRLRLPAPEPAPARGAPLIEVRDVSFRYDNGKTALENVSLDICEGDYIALIGQNGAGKTTLAKHFNSIHKPCAGTVTVCGRDTAKEEPNTLAQLIGYVFQNPDNQIFSTSVYKEMEYGLKNAGIGAEEADRRIRETAELLHLTDVLDEHPFSLGKGERQRIAVASILVLRPKILVVDEPTTGQDWDGIRHMMQLIDELHAAGTTIVMITHDMDVVASHASRVVVMAQGHIVADGPTREVFAQTKALEAAYVSRPQIVELSDRLGEQGLGRLALTADELAGAILTSLEAEQ
ncbi:MAG: energy-coupling factor transporter ATPase [Oscillospiraceae bacterium]|nr:energy-coupling factor transporter ATPase [Oscillospiraceae bacterium]